MKSTKFLWLGVLVLVVLLFASYLIPNFYLKGSTTSIGANSTNDNRSNTNIFGGGWGNEKNGYSMMGGNFGYSSNQFSNEGLTEDKVNKEIEDSLQNAAVDKNKNTITYSGDNIKIVIAASPKQADEKFIIGGLVNPTVYIPKNSNINIELINEDEDTPHTLEITNAAPPYANMTMMQGSIYPGSIIGTIPPAANNKFYTDTTSFKASYDGEFHYICQYPGHAAEGMYGKITVK